MGDKINFEKQGLIAIVVNQNNKIITKALKIQKGGNKREFAPEINLRTATIKRTYIQHIIDILATYVIV